LVNLAPVIIAVAVLASISLAGYFVILVQPNFINVNAGEPVQVGPVSYTIDYIGNHNGDKDTIPENTFFQISIIVENLGEESTMISGGQFYILDINNTKIQPTFGNFSDIDLLRLWIEPKEPITRTTQFDIEYDKDAQYRIGILASKLQSSPDIGIVCVTNC